MAAEPGIVGRAHWTKKGELRLRTLVVACFVLAWHVTPAAAQTTAFTARSRRSHGRQARGRRDLVHLDAGQHRAEIAGLFHAETGIKVELFRSGGSAGAPAFSCRRSTPGA